MISSVDYGPFAHPTEADRLGLILQQCFNVTEWDITPYYQRVGAENYRVVRQGSTVLGGFSFIPMGQWFGGQRLSMTGIAGVGIALEHQGAGTALVMMRHALQELYDQGTALSVLYPATQTLYRKIGYEQGGVYCQWQISTNSIRLHDRPLAVHQVALEPDQFQPLYHQKAQGHNGHLDRHPAIWQRYCQARQSDRVYAYIVGDRSQPEGYLILSQHSGSTGSYLQVRDWALLTPAAIQTFWAILAGQRSQMSRVLWNGSAVDGLTYAIAEQSAKVTLSERWLLRIINLPLALAQRGYPPGLETELHLAVTDAHLPGNQGKWIVTVAEGKGQVTSGGRGDLQIDERGLASLYSGLFSAQQLRLSDRLSGSDQSLAIASALFSGPTPWLADFF